MRARTSNLRLALAALALVPALAACAGDFEGPLRPDSARTDGPARDGKPPDVGPGPDAPVTQDGGACSPTGVAATCDPIGSTGCTKGACYITKQGTACVCPTGTTKNGEACSTSTECVPGHVCAGSKAPGICSKICDPTRANPCAGGYTCVKISGMSYGYCASS